MTRAERWWNEEPRRPPAEYACLLARDRFWRAELTRLIALHPDFDDYSGDVRELLDLEPVLAHGLLLVLSRLPVRERRAFADVFYEERWSGLRSGVSRDPRSRLAIAAAIALLVVDLANDDRTFGARVVDLLQGAAQGDDLGLTPEPALAEVRKTAARVRLDTDYDDPADPHGAAALAITEVLDPSTDLVALGEVIARASWATVECRERSQVLAFLLDVDRILADGPV